jgi:hypothetical protein
MLGGAPVAGAIEKRLEGYRAGQPFREPLQRS